MTYPAITVEGGLFASDLLDRIGGTPDAVLGQKAVDFAADSARLSDAIQSDFSDARVYWQSFQRRREHSRESVTTLTRESLVIPLLELLGFDLTFQRQAATAGGNSYAISHRPVDDEDAPPVHIVGADQELDRRADGAKRSPHALVQEYLNRSGALWGIVTNGRQLRLLRESARLARPTYVEIDLEAIFEQNLYADFTVFWRLCHRSRLPQRADDAHDCWLEQYHQQGIEEGGRVREHLRDGVEEALRLLGTGFLRHEDSGALREALKAGHALTELDFYRQLLRLIYRLLFLMVAEERRLLFLPDHPNRERQAIYTSWYSVSRLRDRAETRRTDDRHADLWQSLRVAFDMFRESERADQMGLTALNGELFGVDACRDLELAQIANDDLLAAIFHLSTFLDTDGGRRRRASGTRRRVNYAGLDVEELGSVYESPLDFHPEVLHDERRFELAAGSERKTTGSYYTPPQLVAELIKSALEPVLEERLAAADGQDAKIAAILDMKICDPAAGSGHFLLAAARRLGRELAAIRSGESEPAPSDYRRAVRDVIRSCIYAVDVNPLAVDLCKVSLWIEGHAAGFPLSFLDHRIKCGNALIGIADLDVLSDGVPDGAYRVLTGDDTEAAAALRKRNRDERAGQYTFDRLFAATPADVTADLARAEAELTATGDTSPDDVHAKEALYADMHAPGTDWYRLKTACDLWCAAFFAEKQTATGAGREIVPTTAIVREAAGGGAVPARMAAYAEDIAHEHRFFHWPLEFADVATAGGFDVMLGNPPWERIKLQEQEFFAPRDRDIAEAPNAAARRRLIQQLFADDAPPEKKALGALFNQAKRTSEAAGDFVRHSGRFPLTAVGDINTYAVFAETFLRRINEHGRSGFIVPTGIATDNTTKAFFDEIITSRRLVSLYDFENREGIFDGVHRSYKFSLVTLVAEAREADFAFFLTRTEHLADDDRHFALSAEDIALINPNTRTCPIFRSKADAELTKNVYRRVSVLINAADESTGNPWQIIFRTRLWHMAEDAEWFRTSTDFKTIDHAQSMSSKEQVVHSEHLPLYEAKMIHQFDHRWATYIEGGRVVRETTEDEKADANFEPTPRYWVPEKEANERLFRTGWTRSWLMGWRDITNSTNERTAIFSATPRVGFGDKFLLLFSTLEPRSMAALVGCMNSIALDFVCRQKIGGTSLKLFTVQQLPVLPPKHYSNDDIQFILSRVLELSYTSVAMRPFAEDMGYDGPPFPWDPDRRALLRAELDAYYAYLYGLTRDELRYILDPAEVMGPDYPTETFRGLKKNEIRKFSEYRTRRLVLEVWDRFAADGTFDPARIATDTCLPIPAAVAGKEPDAAARLAAAEENHP